MLRLRPREYIRILLVCGLIIKDNLQITEAVKVSHSLEDEKTKKREIKGLMEAMITYDLQQGLIITEKESETLKINNKEIKIKPVYEWLNDMQTEN